MQLKLYLKEKGIKQADFANQLGIGKQHLYLWTSGKSKPSARFLIRIQELTNGEVTLQDWV